MMEWFRSWHGAPTDPKWLMIAQRTQTNAGMVSAVAWALYDHASQATDRGDVSSFDAETYAAFSGWEACKIDAIVAAFVDKGLIQNNRLAAWDKRQPKREDGSAERSKEWRERNRTQPNANDHREDKIRTETESKKDIRTVAKATRPAFDEKFEEFKKAYPRRKGANPWKPAKTQWDIALKSGSSPDQIIAAVKAGVGVDLDKRDTEFIPQAVKWLRDRRFDDHAPPADNVVPIGFYAEFGSAELDAWDAHNRATNGATLPRDKRGGWLVPARYPPGYEPQAATA